MNWNCLCPGCMQEKPEGYNKCPMCGYDVTTMYNRQGLLPVWTLLNNTYYIGKSLGAGGFGITYVAFDKNLEKKLCIKEFFMEDYCYRVPNDNTVYANDADSYQTFLNNKAKFVYEAQILAKLDELSGVVRVLNYFEENQTAYIVMDFVEGQSLEEFVNLRGGKLEAEYAFSLLKPVVDSLTIIHDKGIVHRDISPDNIMVTKDGKLKLIDFGAAKGKTNNKNEDKVIKKYFSPPEQCTWQGEIGTYSDVYALCATFYKIITGVRVQFARERLNQDYLKYPSYYGIVMDPVKENIIMSGLQLNIDQRIKNAKDLNYLLYGYANQADATIESVQKQIHDSSTKVIMNKIENEQRKHKNRMITTISCIIVALLGCMIITVNRIGALQEEKRANVTSESVTDENGNITEDETVKPNINIVTESQEDKKEQAELAKIDFLVSLNEKRKKDGENPIEYDAEFNQAATEFAENLANQNHKSEEEWNTATTQAYQEVLANYSGLTGAGWLEIPYTGSVDGATLCLDFISGVDDINQNSGISSEQCIRLINCSLIGIGYGIHEDGSVFWVMFYR